MGNSFACFSPLNLTASKSQGKELLPPLIAPHRRSRKSSSSSSPSKKTSDVFDESYIKQQAQIASMLYHHHLNTNGGDLLLQLDRSVSTKTPPSSSKKFSRRSRSVSSSTTPLSSLKLPTLQGYSSSLTNLSEEKKHFVLVHGGGFGAWCWYKIIALLKEAKCEVDAIDLTGSGANFCDINLIKDIAQYAKPLTDFLANLAHDKEVILVGHDLGGACISYAMEMNPSKVSRAVFVAATMLSDGQSALDVFSKQLGDLNQRAQKFVYANGKKQQPTAISYDNSLLEDIFFNRTPSKDVALASVSMRDVPFAPVTEKLSLSAANYGSIPRFYVKTDDDFAIPEPLQEAMIQSDPPKQVFQLKGADHSPFFSKPQALLRLLLEISNIPQK
ncbi:methyl esterase 13 [Perilla frutescens var. hirtella]|uniref:Methyl esterase 13 n=1 Tax=Perilla frutescens var. hirtella TaxID=608512 RepID=A0AAD4P1Z0_PERFH|nr:methyl esterase 13 [Perilla frutescens var. hirtella]